MDEVGEALYNIESAVEAILFASGYPVAYEKLSAVLGISIADIKTLVSHMAEDYNGDGSTRGIRMLLFEDTCQLCTKEQFAPYIREALGIRRGGNLSASSLEALAIVAYNQPVTRAYIDTVRGVDSNYAVTSLVDKGLIESSGRLDAPGRPMLYVTTEKFLRVFGMTSLFELPETAPLTPLAPDGTVQSPQAALEEISNDNEATEQTDDDNKPGSNTDND